MMPMNVDAEGCITTLPARPVATPFAALVDAAREGLGATGLLHSLYLYGSVARHAGQPFRSDLDLCLMLRQPPSAAVRRQLAQRWPVVSKVDLGWLGDLEGRQGLAWRYWLKHHCVHLDGSICGRRCRAAGHRGLWPGR